MEKLKPIGLGSISPVLLIIAVLFSFDTPSKAAIGDSVLSYMGFEAWSNGTSGFHYTIIVTILLLLITWFLGSRYSHDLGALLGRKLSLWLALILSVMLLFNI